MELVRHVAQTVSIATLRTKNARFAKKDSAITKVIAYHHAQQLRSCSKLESLTTQAQTPFQISLSRNVSPAILPAWLVLWLARVLSSAKCALMESI